MTRMVGAMSKLECAGFSTGILRDMKIALNNISGAIIEGELRRHEAPFSISKLLDAAVE